MSVEAMGMFDSRFFHDFVKHTPLQLTSADFSITISNTLSASTDFSRFFHDNIKHTHRVKSVEAMGVFDIVMEKPAEVSRGDGCVSDSHGKTCWSVEAMGVFDIVMEKPDRFY
jgi:hypothetical protein